MPGFGAVFGRLDPAPAPPKSKSRLVGGVPADSLAGHENPREKGRQGGAELCGRCNVESMPPKSGLPGFGRVKHSGLPGFRRLKHAWAK
jgi:hypothetical protein